MSWAHAIIARMQEIELKLQVPEEARRAVEAAVAPARSNRAGNTGEAKASQTPLHLVAAYFDTPDRRLAAAGMALRLRREGRQWVQTLKAGGPNAMQRLEHNMPIRSTSAQMPALDLARHQDGPGGPLLAAALAPREGESAVPELVELYRTDIRRRTRTRRTPYGSVELAFDEGWIVAGVARLAVRELEIELLRGQPLAVIHEARRWVADHGLWLDTQTKAHRGDHLARGATPAPRKAALPELDGGDGGSMGGSPTVHAAWRRIHGGLLGGLLDNASALASGHVSGTDGAEHVRQLRIGLRRLRAVWRLLQGWHSLPEPTQTAAVALFRLLGQVRDRDALADLLPELHAAGCPLLAPMPAAERPDVADVLRAAPASQLWLDLLEDAVSAPDALGPLEQDAPVIDLALPRLRAWHRKAKAEAARFDELDDITRHALRKRLKRLRDGLDAMRALLPRKALAAYVGSLRQAQDALGRLNDLVVAQALLRARAAEDPPAWFAVGWLAARREAAVDEAAQALKAWRRADAFWK